MAPYAIVSVEVAYSKIRGPVARHITTKVNLIYAVWYIKSRDLDSRMK